MLETRGLMLQDRLKTIWIPAAVQFCLTRRIAQIMLLLNSICSQHNRVTKICIPGRHADTIILV